MQPLSTHQLRRMDRALRRLYLHANDETFPARLLDSVHGLIGSDVTCFTEVPGKL